MCNLFFARCWILVFLSLYVTVAHAQDSVPTHPVDGTFIKEWLVLGPFFPEDLETDFLVSTNGEISVNPKPGDTVTTAEGKTLTWTVYRSEGNLINLLHAVGNHREAVCYTFCLLESERGGDGEILVGSDDGVVVFLNGQRVHTQPVRRPIVVDEDRVAVSLRPGKNRCLMKVSNGHQNWALTARVFPPTRAVIAGVIANETGKTLSNAIVNLWQGRTLIAKTETDTKGNYQFSVYPASGHYDIQATHRDRGDWKMGVQLSTGARVNMNLTLQKAISISGNLLTLDNTPHVGVLVEALSLGERGPRQRRVTTFSDKVGGYKFINLEPGSYQLRYQTSDADSSHLNVIVSVSSQKPTENISFRFPPFKHGTWKNYTYLDGLKDNYIDSIYQDRDGFLWFGTSGGASRYDGEKFVNFTTDEGLASDSIRGIHEDKAGHLWFSTWGVGVSRYDGDKFTNFTTDEGLASNFVSAIHQDREGYIWFATNDGGVSRYDGEKFINFTTDEGLVSNFVRAIHEDKVGYLWFGTWEVGVSRYDGEKFINFTTDEGLVSNSVSAIHQDREGYIWFGTSGGASRYDGEKFINFTTDDGLASNFVSAIHQDREGYIWFGTSGGASRYDGKKFINFTIGRGPAFDFVSAIHQDREGYIWFGTDGNGLSQYDSSGVINFTTADGLVSNLVYTIYQDREGYIWFGTRGGISRYDGEKFINFTTDAGLVHDFVNSVYQDREGFLWFGTQDGVSQYDGEKFVSFTINEGLPGNSVWAIHQDREGYIWFGTGGGGVSQYDGEKFLNFTTDDGLAQNYVIAIHQDREGFLWFGTIARGISRYDGEKFVNFTTDEGLASNSIWAIHEDKAGHLWFGTTGGDGASRYDGEKFVNFTTADGLVQNDAISIYQDREGFLWFGTLSGGVSRYDGTSWVSLDTRDGLISDQVSKIYQDSDGRLWFATLEGVTQYNPNRVSPSVRIVSVQNHKTSAQAGSLETIKDITTDTRVTIKYSSIDFKTLKEKRQYRVRIKEIDSDWRESTRSDTFNISFDKPGTYTFEVVAIDRDLNYSAPASLTLTVVLPWYQNGWILYPSGGAIVILLLLCGILAHRYYHQRQQVLAYQREAVSELADAREMQMGLIPQTAPEVPGLEIAGVCSSARTVGGDFFDYVPLSNGMLAVVLADVTGKGMKGAMNAVLSSGALHSVAQLKVSPSQMLQALNNNLYPRFQRYTNCAMAILTIDPNDKTFKYANAGIPYPIIKRGGDDVEELPIDGTPLGAFQSSEYQETPSIELKSGNAIILFSDGITEAPQRHTPNRFYMETDRLVDLIKGLGETVSAEGVIDAIISDVRDFSGETQQNDDMTIVVIKAL
ncbi:hypothetical protein C6503_05595 [Candidatus Poribacteria bacterium]|nr:MAG: hypothetical protein C6503_05595 [Candidatus Poribacteria bacterium]